MENTLKGKIIKGVGGLYSVRICAPSSEIDGTLVSCRAKGAFRHSNTTPLAGDNVLLLPADSSAEGGYVIAEIIDRRNSLIRPPLANLDYIFVTMAAAHPQPILTTVDKLISIAEHNKIEPIIVITKNDLDSRSAENISEIYKKSGFTVFTVSSVTEDGVGQIRDFIKKNLVGKTAAFAGASGIGKSTLMNALFPDLALVTSEISRKIERGRHTTRQVELFPLSKESDSGYIADTPGFSMLDFERFNFFEKEDLPLTMREFVPLIGQCRYTKCSHTKEEGCAIVEAVKRGDIPKSRHDSFLEIYETLKAKKKW
ncbi:MAG: ribosome small subunit-dependent GTPase A [Clostridia bacterium]|nr:ribosome small subunit-dependent GTPase A [Clostridia bacterium]